MSETEVPKEHAHGGHHAAKEPAISLSKDTVYGSVIMVLVCLLVLAVLTGGFSLVKSQAQQCQNCPLCPNGTAANGTNATAAPVCTAPPKLSAPPVLGQANAPVTIVQYSDYQCPFCNRLYTGAEASLRQKYVPSGKVKIYFRDFPLSFHPNAMPAAVAARCANEQGRFWEMHDKLFENQAAWSGTGDMGSVVKGYARDLGLDAGKFACCYDNYKSQVQASINADESAGQAAGVSGTPASLITIPKARISKAVLEAQINATNSKIGGDISFSESGDSYVVLIGGAYPYESFEAVLGNVSYG